MNMLRYFIEENAFPLTIFFIILSVAGALFFFIRESEVNFRKEKELYKQKCYAYGGNFVETYQNGESDRLLMCWNTTTGIRIFFEETAK